MRSKGDEYRRLAGFADHGVENQAAARELEKHYHQLSCLMHNDLTCECFNITYCRITTRYKDGDFVRQFRALFRSTMKEMCQCLNSYAVKKRTIDGLPVQETADEEE